MLDSLMHKLLNKPLDNLGKRIHLLGISANTVTLVGFFFGIIAILCVGTHHLHQGFYFFLLNRLCDGLDGSIARHQYKTDRGEFLDVVCNFIIYAGMIFGFILSYPEDAIWGAFLIFSLMGTAASSLTYNHIFYKIHNNINEEKFSNSKGATEAVIAISFICLYPEVFEFIALGYGLLCWVTTGEYSFKAWVNFRNSEAKQIKLHTQWKEQEKRERADIEASQKDIRKI